MRFQDVRFKGLGTGFLGAGLLGLLLGTCGVMTAQEGRDEAKPQQQEEPKQDEAKPPRQQNEPREGSEFPMINSDRTLAVSTRSECGPRWWKDSRVFSTAVTGLRWRLHGQETGTMPMIATSITLTESMC